MSHNVMHSTYPQNVDKRKVQREWDEYVAHEDWQEGASGLPGSIRWIDHICEGYDEALEYIESHDKGWYDQLAVMYKDYPKAAPSKTLENLTTRLNCEIAKRDDYAKAHSVLSFKAEYIGCPDCGSKLKRTLLRSDICPLCRTDMRSKTTLDTLARYDANIKALRKRIDEEQKKLDRKNAAKIMWLVKIEYHT